MAKPDKKRRLPKVVTSNFGIEQKGFIFHMSHASIS